MWAVLLATWAGAAWGDVGPASPEPAVRELLAAGDSAMARLALGPATAAYARARSADTTNYEAAWKLARAFADSATLARGATERRALCGRSESLARAAIAIDPAGAKGHAFLAVALGKLAEFEGGREKVRLSREIEAEADSALARDPAEDLAHHVLGVWNREVAELSGVLRFFATVLYGKVPQGSMAQAIEHLRTAAALRPEVIPHHVELGITLADAGRLDEAERELALAVSLPTSWVTDAPYRAKARAALADVRRRSHADRP